MIAIRNRAFLAEERSVVALLKRLCVCISSGELPCWIEAAGVEMYEVPGWVVFTDDRERGLGVNLSGVMPSLTRLRQKVEYVRCAQELASLFYDPTPGNSLHLAEREGCPAGWRVYRMQMTKGSMLCASSVPLPEVYLSAQQPRQTGPRFDVPLIVSLLWDGEIAVGATQVCKKVRGAVSGMNMSCVIDASGEGAMRVELSADENVISDQSERSLSVTVELGELQLSLSEIAGLRPGSVIELEVDMPLDVHMRIGSSVLARAALERIESGFQLVIKEIVYGE